jgi:hypothetical protein
MFVMLSTLNSSLLRKNFISMKWFLTIHGCVGIPCSPFQMTKISLQMKVPNYIGQYVIGNW